MRCGVPPYCSLQCERNRSNATAIWRAHPEIYVLPSRRWLARSAVDSHTYMFEESAAKAYNLHEKQPIWEERVKALILAGIALVTLVACTDQQARGY